MTNLQMPEDLQARLSLLLLAGDPDAERISLIYRVHARFKPASFTRYALGSAGISSDVLRPLELVSVGRTDTSAASANWDAHEWDFHLTGYKDHLRDERLAELMTGVAPTDEERDTYRKCVEAYDTNAPGVSLADVLYRVDTPLLWPESKSFYFLLRYIENHLVPAPFFKEAPEAIIGPFPS